jgi:hypothetical protein
MTSVKFWRENQANEHFSSGKFRIQKSARYAHLSLLPTAVELGWYPKHCTYLILLPILSTSLLFMLWLFAIYFGFYSYKLEFITSVSQFLKKRGSNDNRNKDKELNLVNCKEKLRTLILTLGGNTYIFDSLYR